MQALECNPTLPEMYLKWSPWQLGFFPLFFCDQPGRAGHTGPQGLQASEAPCCLLRGPRPHLPDRWVRPTSPASPRRPVSCLGAPQVRLEDTCPLGVSPLAQEAPWVVPGLGGTSGARESTQNVIEQSRS